MRRQALRLIPRPRACRLCGCTEDAACWSDDVGPCWWVGEDLCSHCEAGIDCDPAGTQEAALPREMNDPEE